MKNEFFIGKLSVRKFKNRTTVLVVPLIPKLLRKKEAKSRVPFTFQPDFPEAFLSKVNNLAFKPGSNIQTFSAIENYLSLFD